MKTSKPTKNIPFKIFILVLIAGSISVAAVSVLAVHIVTLSTRYRVITDEHFENMRDATDIRMLLSRHQALIANHVSAASEDKYAEYEADAAVLETQLSEMFIDFGGRMSGGEREQFFHNAYTAYYSYIENAQNAVYFSRANNKNMADYYVVAVMDNCVKTVNSAFDDLDDFTAAEIAAAKDDMNGYIRLSIITASVSIAVIVFLVIFTAIYCFRITSSLDKYKSDLERDVEAKSLALREHIEKMLNMQNSIVMGMANLIESRDGDTGEHVKRTSVYVNMLAKAAKKAGYETDILTDDYIELMTKAAPLHDIGKIAVSDTILLKPGKLTPEEFEAMKYHAAGGGDIVSRIMAGIEDQEYISIASDIATYHHEKWNGSGYSSGLSGSDIPLCARIMAVADVFDALISKRCYKAAMDLDSAFDVIKESSGSHFDPTLAELFIGLRPDIEEYLSNDEPISP